MKLKQLFVFTSALSTGFIINPCLAEETAPTITETATEEGTAAAEVKATTEEAWRLTSGEFEVGAGYVSDDSYKFGRYTGLNEEGPYAIGGLNLQYSSGRAEYLRLIGTDLGLDSRNILLEYGRQGTFDTYIEYDQLPNFEIDSAVTPFNGAGTDNLTLPSGFSIDNIESYQNLDIETERKRIEGGFSFVPQKHWKVGLSVSRETKQGTGVIGGALAGSLLDAPVGNTATALLPEPIDYVTNKMDLGVDYADKQQQWRLAYQMSLFHNQQESLTWENPFDDDPNRSDEGRLALPPDNQFHQLSLSGAYALSPTTRLTGLFSRGVMLQDEDFQPYTINDFNNLRALPRESLDGKVELTSVRLGLTSRPIRPLRLKASYKYDERDNTTQENQYNYYVLDADTTVQTSAINEPLSYEKHQLDLSARYRFNRYVDGLLGYEYDRKERVFSDVEENEENKLKAEIKLTPTNELDITLKASRMKRDASDYQAESPNQNVFLRKYYLADVEQDTAGVSLFYAPNQFFSLGLRGDWVKEDYTDSAIGLTESEKPSYTLDLSLLPIENINLYAFYTREDFDTKQAGTQTGTTVFNWQADIEDKVDTYGLGIKYTGIQGKVDIGADLVYTKAESDIDMANDSPDRTTAPYPTLSNELKSLKLYALYRLKQAVAVKLSYLHEEYESTDWALDVDANVASNLLLLGNESPEYNNDVVMASVIYRF